MLGLLSNADRETGAKEPYTERQLMSYARSAVEIEFLRVETVGRIQDATGDETVPPIACTELDDSPDLESGVREVVVSFCDRSVEIVRANGLTVKEFGEITRLRQENPDFDRQIDRYVLEEVRGDGAPAQNDLDDRDPQ